MKIEIPFETETEIEITVNYYFQLNKDLNDIDPSTLTISIYS